MNTLAINEPQLLIFFNVFIYLPPLSHGGSISFENGH